jgi:hypothetical protein
MVEIKDIRLYTVECCWKDEDSSDTSFRTVAVGRPDFIDDLVENWTEEQEVLDAQVFYYYDDYAELNQHLKDGDETHHEFIVTKIINK